MNTDPACAADYLAAVGLGKPHVVDGVMMKLDQQPEDMTDGLDLRLVVVDGDERQARVSRSRA